MEIHELFDQSVFVRDALYGVLREGAIAAALTATMILLFLGSWALDPRRDDLDPTVDPRVTGGAVLPRRDDQHADPGRAGAGDRHPGRRFHRHHREHASPVDRREDGSAARDAARCSRYRYSRLVSTLAISCVFTSVVFLDGPAKFLFTPLGLAVVFAMLASYGLSRTLTPITIGLLLKGERRRRAR